MVRSIVCLLFACSIAHTLRAQHYTLKGEVRNSDKEEVAAAIVSLLKTNDSSVVQTVYSDDRGKFVFNDIPSGRYLLNTTSVTYKNYLEPVELTTNKDISITLQKQANALKEVTVSSRKPYIEADLGKTIVNVDESVLNKGTNALEVLKKTPGVMVDAKNNISLQGKSGVLVLIDGRETYLSGEQLADYLKTLSSDDIAQLELITQPSAKYDAAGTAGIINIKTKKNRNNGFFGVATVNYNQGFYPYATETVLLNYKKSKLNLSANINHLDGTGWRSTNSNRVFESDATPTYIMNEVAEAKEIYSNEQLKIGADYTASDKVTFGGALTGIYHPNHEVVSSTTDVQDVANNTLTQTIASTPDHFVRENVFANGYINCDFNKQTNMMIDMNYLDYNRDFYQSSDNKDYDEQGNQIDELYLKGHLPSSVKVYDIKDDFTTVVAHDTKLEAGFKSSFVTNNDDAQYTLLQNNVWVPDTTRSNHFIYNENINALYVSARKSLDKKWEVQAGLRAEQTNVNTLQTIGNQHNNSSSISLFPTAFVGYKLNGKNQFEISFGRRINRPAYQSLNPFIDFVDQYDYTTGNPSLKPEFSDYAEIKHVNGIGLITTLNVTHTTNSISNVLHTDTATQTTITTEDNEASANYIGMNMSYNKLLFKWWQLSAYGGAYYESFTDSQMNNGASVSGTASYLSVDSQFMFDKGWVVEGQYSITGNNRNSAMSSDLSYQNMSFGVSKKVLHDTGTINVRVNDPLNIHEYSEQFVGDNINAIYNYKWHTRECLLSFTYNFGKRFDQKQHTNDVSDETKRINM